jgi:serine/threonine protein kinase
MARILMIGRMLGHYRIEVELGAGGMGVVYRARDTLLRRTVALKLLGEKFQADEKGRTQLLREARAASALNHPNICAIYEVGETEGDSYIVMEYVEGRSLSMVAPGESLSVEMVLRYGAQMADALAHSHDRGIVHRDLKGGNVMVTPDGRVKVLDFGLAKRLPDAELAEETCTQDLLSEGRTIVGTLAYMAPETLRGEPADARSDIWALGVVLHEAAAGGLPFRGQTGFEMTSAILRDPPAQLPDRVPTGLRAVIQRCLAKRPGERYQRAGEVRAALETLQSAVIAKPAAPPVEPIRNLSRRRWLWALVPLVALIAGVSVWHFDQNSLSARPRVSTGGVASHNREANEYFEKARLFMGARMDLTRARQMFERALELDPHFAEARGWYGFTHVLLVETGQSNDTTWLYRAEEEMRRALEDDPNSARAHSGLAAVYYYQGRMEQCREEAEKALRNNPDDLEGNIWLGGYYILIGEYPAAQALMKRLLDRHPTFFPARMNLADILRQQGDFAGATRESEKILEQDPQNLYAVLYLGQTHLDAGDLPRARQTLERAKPSDRRTYLMRLVWALLLAREGKREEALQFI